MKAIDWYRFLQEQREEHGKVVFSLTELANISSLSFASLKVALHRLIENGVMERYATGRYGLPGVVTVEELAGSLDPAAYVTGMYALYRHNLITQAYVEVTCFTNRRHNRSRQRETSVGRFVFVCIKGSAYDHPGDTTTASPEQAMCDFVYLCRKRGTYPADLVTFRNLDRLDRQSLRNHLQRYPATVALETERLFSDRNLLVANPR